ncbi:hypothetical protein [Gilvimarinus sp. 1_MG-2023]|uniref:hypothetical protein n=1 Tax=Gilvimarinus sp. 1_MG-2023 TaxID=3062638 RepID=UPI0026E423DF|nr:hypothetical protein [Gilvimarinus sp. 1_MG-2023]MDO6745665.1 hypothetical protein [Gilvimarinus sp. 1_MG-2023]
MSLTFRSGIFKSSFFLALLITSNTAISETYALQYHATISDDTEHAQMSITIPQAQLIKSINFNLDPDFHSDIEGNGQLEVNDGRAIWHPPEENAKLEYKVALNHERDPGEFDSIRQKDFTIFRGDDLVPPAKVRTKAGVESQATLTFTLPEHWNSVNSGWLKQEDGSFAIDAPDRRFDRPTGWFIAGKLGTRRERLSDTHIAVSAPQNLGVKRMDLVSFILMNWPQFRQLLDELPPKILIVTAPDPMWRGGLSGPNSLFFHADRPMVSENGTSTLLHELFHTLTGITDKGNDDWLVEGLAEYYAIEILYRSGGLSDDRLERIYQWLADWSEDITQLRGSASSGETTARAVLLIKALAEEIDQKTDGEKSLDDITRILVQEKRVDLTMLKESVENLIGTPADVLDSKLLK